MVVRGCGRRHLSERLSQLFGRRRPDVCALSIPRKLPRASATSIYPSGVSINDVNSQDTSPFDLRTPLSGRQGGSPVVCFNENVKFDGIGRHRGSCGGAASQEPSISTVSFTFECQRHFIFDHWYYQDRQITTPRHYTTHGSRARCTLADLAPPAVPMASFSLYYAVRPRRSPLVSC